MDSLSAKGFTLIEVLMVLALIGILTSIIVPLSADYMVRNNIDVAQSTFAQSVRRAQQLSMASDGDSEWGVSAVSGNIVIYKGSSYGSRDLSYDENYDISSAISIGGQNDFSFARLSGNANQTGSVTFTKDNYQKSVSVNAKGIINY